MNRATSRTDFGIRLTPIHRTGPGPQVRTGRYRLEVTPNTVPVPLRQVLPLGTVVRLNGERFEVLTQELDLGFIADGPTDSVLAYVVRALSHDDAPRGASTTYPNTDY